MMEISDGWVVFEFPWVAHPQYEPKTHGYWIGFRPTCARMMSNWKDSIDIHMLVSSIRISETPCYVIVNKEMDAW